MIHRKLGTKRPTYCTLYVSSVQSYNFFAIFAIVNIYFFKLKSTILYRWQTHTIYFTI